MQVRRMLCLINIDGSTLKVRAILVIIRFEMRPVLESECDRIMIDFNENSCLAGQCATGDDQASVSVSVVSSSVKRIHKSYEHRWCYVLRPVLRPGSTAANNHGLEE